MTGRSSGRTGRIVCGVNGSASSRGALIEAVHRAAESGRKIIVVTAYDLIGHYWGALASLPGGHLLPVPDRHWAQAAQDATLRAFVDGVLLDLRLVDDGLPGPVSVETRAVPGDPVDVLVRESAGAAGLVVGHYEEAGPLTSVAAGCARRARCPVIVVPLGSSGDEAGPMARGRCAREGVASPGGRPGPGRREAPRRRP